MRNLLLAVFVFAVAEAHANTYYFSNNSGDDSRTSLQAQNPLTPWKSITKLNDFFSRLLPGDAVLFKRGETFFGSIIISRSGSFTQPITVGAYGSGSRPVITGFTNISGWTALGGGVFESTCASCLATLNMVTINDTLQPIGRFPKADDPNGGYWSILSHSGNSIQSYDLIGRTNFVGGEVVMRKLSWVMDRAIITGQGVFSLAYSPLPSPSHPGFTYEAVDGNGFFIQNHPGTFSRAGEWSYNGATKKFYIYLVGNGIVKASAVESLVNIATQNYVIFDNLRLEGSNSKAFGIVNSNNIQINNCDIYFSGTDGIYVSNDLSNNITVYNCTISNTNNNAITGNNSTNWVVKNNLVRNTGINRGMGQSGDGQYEALSYLGSMSLIQYNEIRNSGYNGIHYGGNGVVIKNNLVDSFCVIKSDGGGIYSAGERNATGRQVTGNIVLNGIGDRYGRGPAAAANPFAGNVHGIYIDNGSSGVLVDGNSVANCANSGLEINGVTNVQAVNNTLFNNIMTQAIYFNQPSSLTVKNNILFANKSDQLISIFNTSNLSSLSIDNNYYCRPTSEPFGVDTSGYSHSPVLLDYPDGGIIQANNSRFYSLDKWKTFSGIDLNSKKTQATSIDPKNVRFEYNATTVNKTISLNGSYYDVKNNLYNNSVTLPPYSSIILMKALSSLTNTTLSANKDLYSRSQDILIETQSDIQISPNPVNNQMRIVFDNLRYPGEKSVTIQSLSGNILKIIPVKSALNILTVNMSAFPSAQYIISVTSKNYKISKKVIKVVQ